MDNSELGINIQKRYLEIEEALPFFPGRKGNKHITKESLLKRISEGRVPKGAVINITGKPIFDRFKLIGNNGNNAA